MRSTERREEIVESALVRDVYGCELHAHLVPVSVKQVVMPDRQIEQMPRRNPRRILVVILCPRRWNFHQA